LPSLGAEVYFPCGAAKMLMTYDIFERRSDATLAFVESAQSLEQAKMRFFSLSFSSRRQYVVWDQERMHEVVLRVQGHT
jgi:hypothetical protein